MELPSKRVQEISMDGDEPPPRYINKNDDSFGSGVTNTCPPLLPIPVIDCSLLEEKDELEKLKSALSSWGCFQLIGHGIPSSFLDSVREVTKEFFGFPMGEKAKYSRANSDSEGYGNDSIFSDKQVLDWSDRLFLTLFPEDSRKLQFWPERPADFREILNEYSKKTMSIMELLLKAMARSLNLEGDSFVKQRGEKGLIQARFNYYPVCQRPDLVLGVKAHSDGSVITILLQDKEVEGLQVLKDDEWIRVPIIPEALVVNLGDQAQIMSNGIFKSPLHRVTVNKKRERISLAVFNFPDEEVEIGPVEALIDAERPKLYRKLKNYREINMECFQKGIIPLEKVKI